MSASDVISGSVSTPSEASFSVPSLDVPFIPEIKGAPAPDYVASPALDGAYHTAPDIAGMEIQPFAIEASVFNDKEQIVG